MLSAKKGVPLIVVPKGPVEVVRHFRRCFEVNPRISLNVRATPRATPTPVIPTFLQVFEARIEGGALGSGRELNHAAINCGCLSLCSKYKFMRSSWMCAAYNHQNCLQNASRWLKARSK